jgi:hypothetical protein
MARAGPTTQIIVTTIPIQGQTPIRSTISKSFDIIVPLWRPRPPELAPNRLSRLTLHATKQALGGVTSVRWHFVGFGGEGKRIHCIASRRSNLARFQAEVLQLLRGPLKALVRWAAAGLKKLEAANDDPDHTPANLKDAVVIVENFAHTYRALK